MSNHQRSSFVIVTLLLGLVAILSLHASYYYPFLADDSLISLRYVARLIAGKGLTWTDGQPVEGYSNLLWMLLIAFPGFFGMDLIDTSRVIGVAGMSTVVFSLLHWFLYQNTATTSYLSLAVGLFFFCMAAPVAVWAIGGLEQPLYASLIALSIPLTIQIIESDRINPRTILWLSLVLGLICITRPDGPLFTVAAFLSIYIGRLVSGRRVLSFPSLLVFASFPVLCWGGQLLFRLYYYGEFVPNTALVKIAPSSHHFINGAEYIADGMKALFPFSLFAILFIIISVLSPLKRSRGIPLLMISALWIPYIIFIGGDIFPAYRHFLPLIVVFTFALIEGTDWALKKFRYSIFLKRKSVFLGFIIISCTSYLGIQFTNYANRRAIAERWEWDGKVVGLLLKKAFSEPQPLLAVTTAGCLPYWSELPALDMLGLNDYYLPRHPPKNFGTGVLGHELGEGKYVLQRRPDIISFFTGTRTAMYRSGVEMQQTKEFYELYTPIKLLGNYPHDYTATLWFYKYSPKIGIQRTPSEIRVPAFLLNGNPDTVAYLTKTDKLVVLVHSTQSALTKTDKLVVPVHSTQSASIVIDSVTSRNWHIEIKASRNEEVQSELKQTGTSLVVRLFSKSPDPIEIEEIVLRRIE